MSLAATTATAFKEAPPLGLVTTLQLVPFHCSISVWGEFVMPPEEPTAQMSVAETTATPFNTFEEGSTLGLLTTLQLVPFHCSTSVTQLVVLQEEEEPTAQMSLAETTATPFNTFEEVPTLGLLTTLQLVPFQCSISVCT